jgi:hypothetical protein
LNPGRRGGKPATNRFSYGAASSRGVVHKESESLGVAMNQVYYLEVLGRLRNRVIGSFELHNNKAPAHTALSGREFLAKGHIRMCKQAPDCPDLSPGDFYLFPTLNRVKGYNPQTLYSVQKVVTDANKTLSEVDFQSCYDAWKIRYAKCVASVGYYFEGDNVDLDE